MIIINIYRIQDEPRNLELWLEKFKKSSVTSIILLLRSLQKKKKLCDVYSYSRLGTYFFNHRKIIYFIVTSFHLTITFSICKIFISWTIFFFFLLSMHFTRIAYRSRNKFGRTICVCVMQDRIEGHFSSPIYIYVCIYIFFLYETSQDKVY